MRRVRIRGFLAVLQSLLGALLLTACATQLPELPVIGTPGTSLPGKVVWHDLVTPDPEQSQSFYAGLFGWRFEKLSDGYLLASDERGPVAGIARLAAKDRASHWLPLVSVSDIEQVQDATRSAGGEVVLKAFELRGRGSVAVLKDPRGAAFGVLESRHGDPLDRSAAVNSWLWNEIWTDDVAASADFYRELLGYRLNTADLTGTEYRYLARDGSPRVGLLQKPDPQIGNTWVCYLRVADVGSAVERARVLGGSVLMAPDSRVRNGRVAVLADPNGAGFVIQEWQK